MWTLWSFMVRPFIRYFTSLVRVVVLAGMRFKERLR